MKQFNEKNRKDIERLVAEINAEENGNIREGMIRAYVNHLPDKERNQGEMMTDRIFHGIDIFYNELKEAEKNPEIWVEKCIEKMGEENGGGQRCDLYRDKIIQFADAAKGVITQDKIDKVLEKLDGIYVPGQENSEETEMKLKELLKNLILEDGALAQKMTEMMVEYAEEQENIELEYNKAQERGLLGAMVMSAYILSKEGRLEGVPSDITLDQITVMVCSMYESSKIVQEAQRGKRVWNGVKFLLSVIGIVASVKLLIVTSGVSFVLLSLFFGTILTGILTAVIFLTLSYWFVKHGIFLLEKGVNFFVDNIARGVVDAGGNIIRYSVRILKKCVDKIKEFCAWAARQAADAADRINERTEKTDRPSGVRSEKAKKTEKSKKEEEEEFLQEEYVTP